MCLHKRNKKVELTLNFMKRKIKEYEELKKEIEKIMWIIAKYKMNELSILKKKLKEILGDEPRYFIPKIKYTKIVKKIYFFSKINSRRLFNLFS